MFLWKKDFLANRHGNRISLEILSKEIEQREAFISPRKKDSTSLSDCFKIKDGLIDLGLNDFSEKKARGKNRDDLHNWLV